MGGIIGSGNYNNEGVYSACYYLDNVNIGGGGKGIVGEGKLTEQQMKQMESFVGFDFDTVWEIDGYHNYPYPQLTRVWQEPISGITLDIPPAHRETLEGLYPDLTGTQATVTYKDGYSISVPITAQMLDYDKNKIGLQNVHLSYGGKISEGSFDLNVLAKSIVSIDITNLPTKTTYVQGQPIDLSGGTLHIVYNNHTDETVSMTDAVVTDFPNSTGTGTVVISYGGFTETFDIVVNDRVVKTWDILTEPDKIIYLEGDSLDLTGAQIKVIFVSDDDYYEVILITADMVSGYESTSGQKIITVKFNDTTQTFIVKVNAKSLISISVTTMPAKITYLEGESLNTTDMVVTAYYNNGTNEVVTPDVTGYTSTPGTKTITVAYQGQVVTFTVTVNAKSLTSILVTTKPTKLIYLEGDSFNNTGMIVTAYYDNGTTEPVIDYIVSGYSSTAGTKTITVSYGGKTVTFTVTVNAKSLISITVTTKPTKITYIVGDSLSTSGMTVTAYYDNDTSATIFTGLTTRYDFNTAGTKTVTVEYGGKSDTFTVTVNSAVPSSITSSTYIATSTTISKITAGMTVTTLLSGLNEKNYIKVYKGSAEVSGSTKLGTGMTVRLMDGSTIKQTITVIVTGDTNGDGDITITDMIAVKAHLLNKSSLSDVYAKAADTNGDSSISITDFIQAKAHILGKESIKGRAH